MDRLNFSEGCGNERDPPIFGACFGWDVARDLDQSTIEDGSASGHCILQNDSRESATSIRNEAMPAPMGRRNGVELPVNNSEIGVDEAGPVHANSILKSTYRLQAESNFVWMPDIIRIREHDVWSRAISQEAGEIASNPEALAAGARDRIDAARQSVSPIIQDCACIVRRGIVSNHQGPLLAVLGGQRMQEISNITTIVISPQQYLYCRLRIHAVSAPTQFRNSGRI